MKSWADHCSSDEESDDEIRNTHPAAATSKLHPSLNLDHEESSASEEEPEEEHNNTPQIPQKREYNDLPNGPPFTAYVRNLSYDIRDNDQLIREVNGLLDRRYEGTDVRANVINARLGVDRDGKRKGYGYIEFGSLEELVAFLDCDDGNSEVMGRNIHIQVANNQRNDKRRSHTGPPPPRRNEKPEIDGSKFRGGRYSRDNNGSFKANNSNAAGGGGEGNGESSQQPRQRPSLRLAPRTKPLADGEKSGGSSASIFGDAKPRDENQWSSSRKSVNFTSENNDPLPSSSKGAAAGVGDNAKGDDASSNASSKDVGMGTGGDEKDNAEAVGARRPSSSSVGSSNKGNNGHGDRHDRNHGGNKKRSSGTGRGRGGGNAHDKNSSSSSLGSSGRGRGGGRGRGRGQWDGSRRESGRGGGGRGGGHEKRNSSGRGGGSSSASNGDAKKRPSATNAEPANALPAQAVVKESKPKPKVTNAFAALNFDDSDSD